MKNRDEFGKFLLSHGLRNRGVEIGTFKADFAKRILMDWPGSLYMIDVWRALPKEEYDDCSNHENHIDAYARAIENLSGFEDRAFMLRMKGEQSADFFRDNSLDFVYIDANHTYKGVKNDIQLWYPKVKSGGVVSGHDFLKLDSFNKENYKKGIMDLPIYAWSNDSPEKKAFAGMFGVNPAVEEFCEEHGYEFKVTDEWFATWWFIKK